MRNRSITFGRSSRVKADPGSRGVLHEPKLQDSINDFMKERDFPDAEGVHLLVWSIRAAILSLMSSIAIQRQCGTWDVCKGVIEAYQVHVQRRILCLSRRHYCETL